VINKVKKSFGYALSGLVFFWQERNIKIHIFVALLVVFFGFYFSIKLSEWLAIIFAISLVLAMEMINTAIEELADFSCSVKNGQIMKIKDLAAGAVLVCAVSAIIIGLIVFLPYFAKILS